MGEIAMTRILALLLALAATLPGASACAAELKVISAGAVRSLIAGMIEDYSKASGHTFDFTVGTTGQLRNIIASGEAADLIIASGPLMAELEQTGKMTAGSRADLGRMGIGIVIREGAPAPDVATPDAFKQTLIDARSVSYTAPSEGGTSGIHVMDLLKRFGVIELVERKAVHANGGREVTQNVADGKAEIGITLISEILPVKGAKLTAPLPESLQLYTVYAAAIPASSKQPAATRAFITHLTSEALATRWKAAGFEPPK